jgi:hypothetical protein
LAWGEDEEDAEEVTDDEEREGSSSTSNSLGLADKSVFFPRSASLDGISLSAGLPAVASGCFLDVLGVLEGREEDCEDDEMSFWEVLSSGAERFFVCFALGRALVVSDEVALREKNENRVPFFMVCNF